MYLTRLVLNPRSRRAQSESANLYELHRTIMAAFPATLPADERVLFRLETDRQSGAFVVLVQSQYKPDWGWLATSPPDYLLPLSEPNPWVKPFDPVFSVGQQLVFRLRANPTLKREGKRLGLLREEQQIAWLQRKAQTGGFDVLSVRTQKLGFVRGWTRGRQPLSLFAVQYDGVLRVIDPSAFAHSLIVGLGSAKGLGFGLLSVARVG
ncbi:MAG: type I-E CRISPR-associated protein Cas6/Cse3/CasE [Aggregatilineaceae bacterium]